MDRLLDPHVILVLFEVFAHHETILQPSASNFHPNLASIIDYSRKSHQKVIRLCILFPECFTTDLIDKVGPDGDFLTTSHTLEYFRSHWYPTLIERNNYAGWLRKGSQDLGQRAAARSDQILAEHTPEPLPKQVKKDLQRIL